MRAVFMNLLLLVAFQVITTLVLAELNSDEILTKNYEKMIVGDHEFLQVRNSEEELWRTAEIIFKKNLDATESFQKWIDETPGEKVLTTSKIGCSSLYKINSTLLLDTVNSNNKTRDTKVDKPAYIKCNGDTVSHVGIKISTGGAARVIWSGQQRYWQ